MSRHRDIFDMIEHPPAMRPESEIRKFASLLDQVAAEDADKARKQCIKLLRGMLGNGGLQAFLKCPQPAYDDLTGDQVLVRDPHGLLARLEELDRGAQ